MKRTIFMPKVIKVGYQNRKGTYTGKLAYIIYIDEKGKIRKEHSWNSWRDNKIEPQDFDNIPTEGFVINKKVGDYHHGHSWENRNAWIRVYDPRGFEFEISVENLLYILENTSSIKGKGLEGEFIYGWQGKDLILIPTCSPDYKEMKDYSKTILENKKIGVKDLKIGATYLDKSDKQWTYMGKFDYWKKEYIYGERKNSIYSPRKEIIGDKWITKDKKRFFINSPNLEEKDFKNNSKYRWSYYNNLMTLSSIPGRFVAIVSEECHEKYAELMDWLERQNEYSPIDKTKDEYKDFTLEELNKELDVLNKNDYKSFYFYSNKKRMHIEYKRDGNSKEKEKLIHIYKLSNDEKSDYTYWKHFDTLETIEEFYNKYKPQYKNVYLKNGKLYQERITD